MIDLSGKCFLVTGATGGIGKAIVEKIVSCGARVCISGTNEEVLNSIVQNHGSNGTVVKIKCNLSDKSEREALVDNAEGLMGGFDGVVCNAGITRDMLSMKMKEEDWSVVIDINLTANFIINKNACAKLKAKRAGRIVNIASVVAFTGNIGQVNYTAAKGGLVSMTKSFAREYAARGITVNAIAPGFIETNMTSSISEKVRDSVISGIPMKRFGQPEDIAGITAFLLCDNAGYITGQTMHVNGGMLMY